MSKKLDAKQSVRVATVNSIPNLKEADNNIDGIVLNEDDRVLVKNGASKDGLELVNNKRNGIYVVKKINSDKLLLQRSKDANKNKEVTGGMFTFVNEGLINKDTGWFLITDDPIQLDATPLVFENPFKIGEVSAGVQESIDKLNDNIALNAFRIAIATSAPLFSMVNGILDEYEDESGVDSGSSTNLSYDDINDLYKNENKSLKLMLHCNGLDGATFTSDESLSGYSPIFNGNAQLDTAEKKFGSASLLLDGSGDYLTIPDSTDWDLVASTTEDWTIDLWAKPDTTGSFQYLVTQREAGAIDNEWLLVRTNTGGLRFFVLSNGSFVIDTGDVGSIPVDASFHHVVLVKKQDEYGLYIDGTQVGYVQDTSTDNFGPQSDGSGLTIGALMSNTGPVSFFDGHLDEIRIQKSNIFSAAPNVGLTDTITVPTSETVVSNAENFTLISTENTAVSQPEEARGILFVEKIDTITPNTDIKLSISRDNGTTYDEVNLVSVGEYESGKCVLAGNVDLSSQPVGTSVRYKVDTLNDKALKLHGAALNWK